MLNVHVLGRRLDPGRRLPHSDGLLRLVHALRQDRAEQSLARDRPRVADHVAAAHRELRGDARRRRGGLRLRFAPEGGRSLSDAHAGAARRTTSATSTSSRRPRPWGCGSSSPRRSCSSAASSPPTPSTATSTTTPSPRAATTSTWKLGASTPLVLICSSFTMAMGVYSAAVGEAGHRGLAPRPPSCWAAVFLGVKYVEYHEKIAPCFGDGPHTGCLVPGPRFDAEALHLDGAQAREAQIYFSLYFAMTGLHALHMIIGVPILLIVARNAWDGVYTPAWHTPGRARRASTGTSSTSSGSSSSPCSI